MSAGVKIVLAAMLCLAATACRRTAVTTPEGYQTPAEATTLAPAPTTPATTTTIPTTTTTMPTRLKAPELTEPPLVRVLLDDMPKSVTIKCTGSYVMRPHGPRVYPRRTPWEFTTRAFVSPEGIKIGTETYNCDMVDVEPSYPLSRDTIKVEGRAFPRAIRLIRVGNGLAVVNMVDMETYLRGSVPAEMPADWHPEALKAQAVASRSYALYHWQLRTEANYDVVSSVDDQVYRGAVFSPAADKAIAATRGQVLTHDDELFPAYFHSTCGGNTETPAAGLGRAQPDWMKGVPCNGCEDSPHFRWAADFTGAQLLLSLKDRLASDAPVSAVSVLAMPLGRNARVQQGEQATDIPILDFRRALGAAVIRSGRFNCVSDANGFHFIGSGLGHGVGMCQYGARGMANAGKSCETILQHYYPGTETVKLYQENQEGR